MFAQGYISFGAARLRFFSAWFVVFLPSHSLHLGDSFYISLSCMHSTTTTVLTKNTDSNGNIFVPLSKMSRYRINKKIGPVGDVGNRFSTAKRKLDASKNRLFRISIMSCACLLMNTAATVSMAVVLVDWSVSSNLWLRCTIFEEAMTRDWAAYGLHEGSRFESVVFPQRELDIF
jgi:hypothetical protein